MTDEKKANAPYFTAPKSRRTFLAAFGAGSLALSLSIGCKPIALSHPSTEAPPSPATEKPMKHPTIIDAVHLRVADLERTSTFYEEILGLSILQSDPSLIALGIAEEPNAPLLYLHESPRAPHRTPGSAGLFHIAFRVPDEPALADALRRIRNAGHHLDGASDHEISHALYLRDPEHNGLEIYFDMPQEEWPVESNGQLRLATRRLDFERLLHAPATETPERLPAGSDIGHIHLEGIQIPAARRFYTGLLGLGITVEAPSVLFTSRGGYHHHIGINTWNRRTAKKSPHALGLHSVDLQIPELQADALRASATELGFHNQYNPRANTLLLRDADNIDWVLHL